MANAQMHYVHNRTKNATFEGRTRNLNRFGPDSYAAYNMASGERDPAIFTDSKAERLPAMGAEKRPPPLLQTQSGTAGRPWRESPIFQVPEKGGGEWANGKMGIHTAAS